MNRTDPSLRVARVLLARPDDEHYGYETCKAAQVRSGVGYPIIHRMLAAGWLTDGWEDAAQTAKERRPPRRSYRIADRAALEAYVGDEGRKRT